MKINLLLFIFYKLVIKKNTLYDTTTILINIFFFKYLFSG